jgi:geranylgeranyl diphosphate synthase type II
MASLEQLQEKIVSGLKNLNFNREPAELYAPISYTLEMGGKRLRPALCLLACDLVGGRIEEALDPALGIEIFHNFTLLHDDIMDKAPLRRGKDTVHIKWDANAAILSGDTMMALSYEYIMKAPERICSDVFSVFNKTAIEVCEGQQFDMNFETAEQVGIDNYLEMIRLKTAVLLAGSLKIGALIGGASKELAESLYRFGENIGIAFQLKDDLLDAFSDAEKFGKTTGGDIVTNKKTFLYLKAFERADEKQKAELNRLFRDPEIHRDDKVAGVLAVYEALNIKGLTEEKIDHFYGQAKHSLAFLQEQNLDTSELERFALQLKQRDF